MIEEARTPNIRFAAMLADGKQSAVVKLSANIGRTEFYWAFIINFK